MKTIQLTKHNQEVAAAEATEILQEGGVALFPTDTAYGLGAAADSADGIEYLLKLKGRDPNQPLSVIVPDEAAAERIAELNPTAKKLWAAYLPGPLTVILPAKKGAELRPETIKDGLVGIRQPKHELCEAIGERFGKPFTATSANISGEPPAYEPNEFLNSLTGEERPHLVIDAGRIPMVPVSTVVKVGDSVEVLREGAIPTADIMKTVGADA